MSNKVAVSEGESLQGFLQNISEKARQDLVVSNFIQRLPDSPIKKRILDYSMRGGKFLRPGLVCAAAGAVGGDPEIALPVGIAVEITHTWTLVHDDIIDRDEYRRGGLTIHAQILKDFKDWEKKKSSIPADHLSHSLALLIGDAQHGMALEFLARPGLEGKIQPELILYLISELEGNVLPVLLTGEVADVFQSAIELEEIKIPDIEVMLRRKTGALLTYCVVAGGLIGLGKVDLDHPYVKALREYGENLGLAFQLRDDILGILGDETKIGKPVGSDFREGKRTMAVKFAYDHADLNGKREFERLIGKSDITVEEVETLRQMVMDNRGIETVEKLSGTLIKQARNALKDLPRGYYRDLLDEVAAFTIARQV